MNNYDIALALVTLALLALDCARQTKLGDTFPGPRIPALAGHSHPERVEIRTKFRNRRG
jgi:hypothetical protein